MVVSNSIRQLIRTPVKTFFFVLLLSLAVAFFLLGFNLWFIARNNTSLIEKNFTTIGTVEQKPISVVMEPETERKDTLHGYISYGWDIHIEYGEAIPASVLDLEGAGYIMKPEQRPVYIASHPDYVVSNDPSDENMFDIIYQVIGITANPIPVRVKRVLYGKLDDDNVIILDHSIYDTPWKLYKGKTYIACLISGPKVEGYEEFSYIPYIVTQSYQYAKDGNRIPDAHPVS